MGPASYEKNFGLTERRADIGINKFKEPIVAIKEEEEDERPNLYPNYEIDKPNHLVFKYHEPSKDLGPEHTPEKDLNPGKWRFYDLDYAVLREEVAKEITFARNLTP